MALRYCYSQLVTGYLRKWSIIKMPTRVLKKERTN